MFNSYGPSTFSFIVVLFYCFNVYHGLDNRRSLIGSENKADEAIYVCFLATFLFNLVSMDTVERPIQVREVVSRLTTAIGDSDVVSDSVKDGFKISHVLLYRKRKV